jgi:ABC-type uncharacterized transport system substrate-binding protein
VNGRSRREFLRGSLALAGLGLLAGCGLLPGREQPPAKPPTIGVLSFRSVPGPLEEAFREGLRERGYVEGQNVAIEWRFADGRDDRFPELAAELVRLGADVIVSMSSTATRAAQQATATIPIVMAHGGDPVGAGLVASFARPGANVTGVSSIAQQLAGKRLELVKEAFPSASRMAVLWNPTNPAKPPEWGETQRAAATLGVQLVSAEVRSADDFDAAFQAVAASRADSLLVFQESLTIAHRPRIAAFALQQRLPSMSEDPAFPVAGGLMAYGSNDVDLRRLAATYVDKILKGAKPADLPIEQPTRFVFAINLKTAQALGLTVPQSLLVQATELIQ